MNAINRLKREHDVLRSKLNVLESALDMGTEAWFVLQETSFTLSKQLQAHSRREEALFACYRAARSGERCGEILAHQTGKGKGEALRAVNQFFLEQPRGLLETIRPAVTTCTAWLRSEMEQQEDQLFPCIEDALVLDKIAGRKEHPIPAGLTDTMTVQEVMGRYPTTRSVLEGLFIDRRFEGYDCLDEVAWRHGMESRELLALLEEHVARPTPQALASEAASTGASGMGWRT
jgi:hypothetical protein